MTVASEISRLQSAKNAIKAAIESKGVTVPSNTKIDGYGALISSIQTGVPQEDYDNVVGTVNALALNTFHYGTHGGASYAQQNKGLSQYFYNGCYIGVYLIYSGVQNRYSCIFVSYKPGTSILKSSGTVVRASSYAEDNTLKVGYEGNKVYICEHIWIDDVDVILAVIDTSTNTVSSGTFGTLTALSKVSSEYGYSYKGGYIQNTNGNPYYCTYYIYGVPSSI